eukprot:TRINITY_DN16898_c0_g1_i1.p1 TRINITY_DN16898_c0_g1~~TRINITY_DN16898_c0_g1_i1.p1  ORF type:complete len:825 (-),score=165.78 TRINITY_DN16898_c0_g1_i1:97-2571(-)
MPTITSALTQTQASATPMLCPPSASSSTTASPVLAPAPAVAATAVAPATPANSLASAPTAVTPDPAPTAVTVTAPAPPAKGKGGGKAPPPPAKGKGKGKAPGPPPLPPRDKGGGKAAGKSGLPGLGVGMRREESAGPRLRPLFWQTSRRLQPGCVWESLEEPAPFDLASLEEQFIAAARGAGGGAASSTGTPRRTNSQEVSEASPEGKGRQKKHILEQRTSQRLEIEFRKLPPPERLAKMLQDGHGFPESLPAEALLSLHNAASEHAKVVEMIRQLDVSEEQMSEEYHMPERYLWVLGNVPSCTAKLACGALLVGARNDIGDLRQAGERVGVCCQALRASRFLRRCLSTFLAMGNVLNRGTARGDAVGVVLPDSLSKLDELRVNQSPEEAQERKRPLSLLDILVQVMVDEDAKTNPKALDACRSEAEDLLGKLRSAVSVVLDDVQANCKKIHAQALSTQRGLGEFVNASAAWSHIASEIRDTCAEVEAALEANSWAREEQGTTMTWFNVVPDNKLKINDWYSQWAKFFEQVLEALGRAKMPEPRPELPPPPLRKVSTASERALQQNTAKPTNAAVGTDVVLTQVPGAPSQQAMAVPPVQLKSNGIADSVATAVGSAEVSEKLATPPARKPRKSLSRRIREVEQPDEKDQSDVSEFEEEADDCSSSCASGSRRLSMQAPPARAPAPSSRRTTAPAAFACPPCGDSPTDYVSAHSESSSSREASEPLDERLPLRLGDRGDTVAPRMTPSTSPSPQMAPAASPRFSPACSPTITPRRDTLRTTPPQTPQLVTRESTGSYTRPPQTLVKTSNPHITARRPMRTSGGGG